MIKGCLRKERVHRFYYSFWPWTGKFKMVEKRSRWQSIYIQNWEVWIRWRIFQELWSVDWDAREIINVHLERLVKEEYAQFKKTIEKLIWSNSKESEQQ